MPDTRFDVVGIGNAIVDVLSHATDDQLEALGVHKGIMTLVDEARAEMIYAGMGPGVEMSGGSAANTLAGLAALGGRGAFIGKVRNDELGSIFRHDIQAVGITYRTPPAEEGPRTARCLVLVTPDAQRTMQTFLGACTRLGPDDVDAELVAASRVTYLEGYLWDEPHAKEAFRKAARLAHDAGRRVALSLSDPFCVDRHRDSFLELVDHHVDILFANEAEITALYQTDDFEAAVRQVRGHCSIAALTRSEKGSVVVTQEDTVAVPAEPVAKVADTTGAGDMYAAGFLYGLTRGLDMSTCARIGSIAAAEVISHFGARPDAPLAELVAERLPEASVKA